MNLPSPQYRRRDWENRDAEKHFYQRAWTRDLTSAQLGFSRRKRASASRGHLRSTDREQFRLGTYALVKLLSTTDTVSGCSLAISYMNAYYHTNIRWRGRMLNLMLIIIILLVWQTTLTLYDNWHTSFIVADTHCRYTCSDICYYIRILY